MTALPVKLDLKDLPSSFAVAWPELREILCSHGVSFAPEPFNSHYEREAFSVFFASGLEGNQRRQLLVASLFLGAPPPQDSGGKKLWSQVGIVPFHCRDLPTLGRRVDYRVGAGLTHGPARSKTSPRLPRALGRVVTAAGAVLLVGTDLFWYSSP